MLALWLIASHLVGDFLLQNRWQATLKTGWAPQSIAWRAQHVAAYTLAFVPVAVVYGPENQYGHAVAFLAWLAVLHFLTDSRRFLSTPADVIQWRIDYHRHPDVCKAAWLEHVIAQAVVSGAPAVRVTDRMAKWPTPNPWPPMPLAIDQTLHVVQIAALAAVFLA